MVEVHRDEAPGRCDIDAAHESEADKRRLVREPFGRDGETVWMQPLFFCDYGANVELGERLYFNFNCVVLDVASVTVGDFTLVGPAVQI